MRLRHETLRDNVACMNDAPTMRPRGRPRGFDERDALDAATRCFWSKGYDRASVAVLCDAMSLSRASLYSEFGDKDRLFLAAVDHYVQTYSARPLAALTGEGDPEDELRAFFDAMIDLVTGNPDTPGCLIACVLPEAATAKPKYRALLAEKTGAFEARIAHTLCGAGARTEDPAIGAKAGMLAATARGLAISARAGIPAARLREIGQFAVRAACTHNQVH